MWQRQRENTALTAARSSRSGELWGLLGAHVKHSVFIVIHPILSSQGGNEPRSFKMQAKEIGVSVRVIERIASRGLEKLRHPSRAAYLLPFLDMPGLGNGGGLDSED